MHSSPSMAGREARWLIALVLLVLGACGGGGGSPPTAPLAPTIGQATPGDRALSIAFLPPSADGGAPIAQYTATCRGGVLDSASASGNASPITVGGLVNGREYTCSVTARNSVGEGPASATVTAVPYTVPGAPTLGASTAGDGSIELSFTAPSDDGGNRILDYELLCTGGGETRSVTGPSSPLRLTSLRNGTSYSCAVSARNAAGKGRVSPATTVTPRTVPAAPTISSIAVDINSLVVTFAAPGSDGGAAIGSYTAGCTSGSSSRSASGSSSPIIVTGLFNDLAYACTVRAANVAGEGAQSAAVSATPRDLARETQLAAAVDSSGRRVTLSWRDVFSAGTTYRIESQPLAGGGYTPRTTVTGGGGSGATLTWSIDINESTWFRVLAVRVGLPDVPITTAQGVAAASVAFSTVAPTIAFDASEPLSGVVRLYIGNRVAYPRVDWFVNLNPIGAAAGTAGNPVDWNTAGVANGEYLILARIQTATNTFIELRRTVRVANVTLELFSVDGSGSELFLVARARSSSGIVSVEGTFAGAALPPLTAPNCPSCASPGDTYRWSIDRSKYSSGAYPLIVTAVDRDGNRRTVEIQVQIRNPPVLTLQSPQRYDIVQGRLVIRGQVSTDRPGGLRTTATLGSLTVLDTTALSFDTSFDLAGLTGGLYRLTVRSVDSAGVERGLVREVIVTESADRVYTPVLTLADNAQIIATDGRLILYQEGSAYRLQPVSGGAPVTLSGAESLEFGTDWQVVDGRVYAQARGSDCTTRCIYEWDAGGARRNLSTANPFASVGGARCSDEDPTVRGNFVIWANWLCGKGQYTILNRSLGAYQKIDPPAGANYIGNNQFDILADGSSAFIWAQMGGTGMSSTFDVFRASGGNATRLSTPGLRNVYPRTNGSRVVWEQSPIGGNPDGNVELLVTPVAGGAPRSVATNVLRWELTEQALVWIEATARNVFGTVTATAVRVELNGNITTISNQNAPSLLAATRAQVLYVEAGRFYHWDASQGVRTLVLEVAPQQLFAKDGVVLFTFGPGRVYRLSVP